MLWPIGLINFLTFFSLLMPTIGQYGSECLLPNQQMGRCLPVVSCKPLHEFFEKVRAGEAEISPADSERFSKLFCGKIDNVSHACCSESDSQLNPDGLNILKNQTCGLSIARRISHGREAALSAFPWMALLIYDDVHDPYKCGGALISQQYVLTAAHCINDDLYQVRLGEHRISTDSDCTHNNRVCALPVVNADIKDKIVHQDYKRGGIDHDISLIRLKRKIQLQNHIKPICLPIYDELRKETPENTIMSGWGKTEKAISSDVLKAVVLPLVERDECQQILKIRRPLTYAHICAGNTNLADACHGDSGGPLAYRTIFDGMRRIVQLGVMSTGTPLCGAGNAPSIYTNISHYLQWVTDNMKP